MSIEINVGGKSTLNIQTAGDSAALEAPKTQAPSKLLGGDSLKVTDGTMTDLEKLVAQLKNESADARQSVAQRRISILQTVLDSMADRISEAERENLVQIEDLNAQKSAAAAELAGYKAEKSAAEGRIAVLDAQIKALEDAVDRAVKDGEDHRRQVAELKAQLAEEQGKLDQIENAISSTSAKIAGIDAKIATCTQAIGAATLNEVSEALRAAASDAVQGTERTERDADRVKAEAKAAATDIAALISDALDKIDAQIRQALDEAQMKVEG